ncbi:MAG: hypothetical protein JW866_08490, partial [Ignavibacteriales bacterium]|nr:hypothetical protein [Ignavibacteriales bacterium]
MRYLIYLILITFYSITAQVVNTISNGDYLLKTEIYFDVDNDDLDNSIVYTLYKNDSQLYTISDLMYRSEPLPTAGIFDSGVMILVYSLSGRVVFYDITGAQIAGRNLDVEYNIQYESTVLLDINQDIAGILISNPEEPKSRLFIYNSDADRINVIEVTGFQGSGIKF